jgi:hypothetical protein
MQHDDQIGQANPYAAPKVQESRQRSESRATEAIDLAVENPFLTIWTRPRATIRGIVNADPTHHVMLLAMAGGVIQAVGQASTRNAGDKLALSTILIAAVATGAVGGMIQLYLSGWLLRVAGGWLGGRAEGEEVRAALAWAVVPTLATIPILGIQLALFGHEMFTSETPYIDSHEALGYALFATSIIEMVLGCWSFVIMLKCVGEVNGFSAWRALGSVFVAGLCILVPLGVLIILLLSARG